MPGCVSQSTPAEPTSFQALKRADRFVIVDSLRSVSSSLPRAPFTTATRRSTYLGDRPASTPPSAITGGVKPSSARTYIVWSSKRQPYGGTKRPALRRSEEHTSELQSR